MQNNVSDLSWKLQQSLDNNYNVTDMPAVIEIISTLEKTSITKELLETTRLGKSINELRRRTSNESLAKRAKELLKRWRDLILPDAANGQLHIRSSSANSNSVANATVECTDVPCPTKSASKKRPAPSTPPDNNRPAKRSLVNGQNREFEFSDNSNCSMKDLNLKKTDVIFINSDSNSSMPEAAHHGDHFDVSNDTTDNTTDSLGLNASSQLPKKRGRKKGSKNHKNLVIAAEESFTNKMAVSRNSKVKTTQELLADIQNRKPSSQQDIELRAAQLTESLSRIEHKLNPQKQINKNVTSIRNDQKNSSNSVAKSSALHRVSSGTVSESWSSRSSPEVVIVQSDDEIVDVVGTDPPSSVTSIGTIKPEVRTVQNSPVPVQQPLTIANLLSQLPPVDVSCLDEPDEIPICECPTPKVTEIPQPIEPQERITVQIVGDGLVTGTGTKETSLFAPPSPLTFFSAKTERLTPSSDLENDDASLRTSASVCDGDGDGATLSDQKSALSDRETTDLSEAEVEAEADAEEYLENPLCPAKLFLRDKYHLDSHQDETVDELNANYIPNVNGNYGTQSGVPDPKPVLLENGLFANIVPILSSERLIKTPNENFQKYSISIDRLSSDNEHNSSDKTHISTSENNSDDISKNCDTENSENANLNTFCASESANNDRTAADSLGVPTDMCGGLQGGGGAGASTAFAENTSENNTHTDFREWHETLDIISYNDELLRILPYVIID